MPVFRSEYTTQRLPAQKRKSLVDRLTKELSGDVSSNGPAIFEIQLEQSNQIDLLVVWEEWDRIGSEDRTNMILDVYKKLKPKSAISQALGVTFKEALDQQLLPYAVIPMARPSDIDYEQLKKSLIEEGGFALPNGKVNLFFPSMVLAEEAHRKLTNKLPKGYWSIVHTVVP